MKAKLVEIRDLTIRYRSKDGPGFRKRSVFEAVRAVSFEIFKGETLALVGESGSGKTSVAMALLGFTEPAQGSIFYDAMDIRSLAGSQMQKYRRSVQPVFQDSANTLNPRMTVGAMMEDSLWPLHDRVSRRKRIAELFDAVGLDDRIYRRYSHQLSGGQKQRVALARALAPRPELLVLDEPFSAQDASIQINLIQLLRNIKTTFGCSYLLISHDLHLVKFLADRIAIMKSGEIVETGNCIDIFLRPVHPYTQLLLKRKATEFPEST